MREYIIDNWDVVRKFLPPTFSGKYDKDQFSTFLESNLNALGFLLLCNGLILSGQLYSARRLRKVLKEESDHSDATFALKDGV